MAPKHQKNTKRADPNISRYEAMKRSEIRLAQETLETSLSNYRDDKNQDLNASTVESVRSEWENVMHENMQKTLVYIEQNDQKVENIQKKINEVIENELSTIQTDLKNLQKSLGTEKENRIDSLKNEIRKLNATIEESAENIEKHISEILKKEIEKLKVDFKHSIQEEKENSQQSAVKEVNTFYDTVIVHELNKRDRLIDQIVTETQENVRLNEEEAGRKFEEMKKTIENLLSAQEKSDEKIRQLEANIQQNKARSTNQKEEIDELDARTIANGNEIREMQKSLRLINERQNHPRSPQNTSPIHQQQSRVQFYEIDQRTNEQNRNTRSSTRFRSLSPDRTINIEHTLQQLTNRLDETSQPAATKIKLKPPIFKANNNESPVDFLERMGNYIRMQRMQYAEIKCVIEDSLYYAAGSWWRTVRNKINSYEEFEHEFREEFWNEDVKSEIGKKIAYGKYDAKRKKTRVEYAMHLYIQGQELGTFSERKLVEMIAGHFEPHIMLAVKQKLITDFKSLMETLKCKDKTTGTYKRNNLQNNDQQQNEENRERGGLSNQEKERPNPPSSNDNRITQNHDNRHQQYNNDRRPNNNRNNNNRNNNSNNRPNQQYQQNQSWRNQGNVATLQIETTGRMNTSDEHSENE